MNESLRGPSMKDVAALAGVSIATVSNSLNRPDKVTETTRAKVLAAVEELGFVRNESARQLRVGTSRTLAYVMLDARSPFFMDVARGIEDTAEEHDLTVLLCNSDSRPDRERAHLELLEQRRIQGVLVSPVDPASPTLDLLAQRGTPIVIVDRTREGEDFCSVAVDDVLGGRLALEHLLDLGHERVAFVGGPPTLGQVRDRLQGAKQVLLEAGRSDTDLVVLNGESFDAQEGREAGMRLAGLPSSRRPTAAFCVNDVVAFGLLQQANRMGLRVPDDLAIVGYDDIDFAAEAAVPLTSVRQPRKMLGRTAAELVLEEATDPFHKHQQVVFTPELVARTSTLG